MPENRIDKTLIDCLFPSEVITEQASPASLPSDIYPEEEVFIKDAVTKRRQEFIAGRLCAKRLLARFGIHDFPVLMGKNREPLWPPGIIGSISHADEYCGVAVARKTDVRSIGLDVERVRKLSEDVYKRICTKQELAWIGSVPPDSRQMNATLVFSAKECLYKCQYSICGQWLELHDVTISVDSQTNEFDACFSNPLGKKTYLTGRYFFHGGYVFTGMTIRNLDRPSLV